VFRNYHGFRDNLARAILHTVDWRGRDWESPLGRLTTHVLDTASGRPAKGVRVELFHLAEERVLLVDTITNEDGRCDAPLLDLDAFQTGGYELIFHAGGYFKAQGQAVPDPPFLDEVVIRFGIAEADSHYHVPLLLSPYGYSTYRGS
jgi:5-hydroxyisourate hydrolase